jgi:hypothetical protein
MNIYLVTRTDDWSYDDFTAIVVVAKSPFNAKRVKPYRGRSTVSWTEPKNLKAEKVGTTHKKEGTIILESFNAG